MWTHPINSESLGRNKLKTRNQIGIPNFSVNIGIGMYWLPAKVHRPHLTAATYPRLPSHQHTYRLAAWPILFVSGAGMDGAGAEAGEPSDRSNFVAIPR
jgi:hypothetical protein